MTAGVPPIPTIVSQLGVEVKAVGVAQTAAALGRLPPLVTAASAAQNKMNIANASGAKTQGQLNQMMQAALGPLKAQTAATKAYASAVPPLPPALRSLGREVANVTTHARGMNVEFAKMPAMMQAGRTGMLRMYGDATALGNGFRTAAGGVDVFGSATRKTVGAATSMGRELADARGVVLDLGRTSERASRTLVSVGSSGNNAGRAVSRSMREATDSTTGFLGALLRIQAVYLTIAAVAGSVATLARFEDTQDAFTALNRGNVYAGRRDFDFARMIAKTTPQTMDEVMKAMIGHRNVGLPTSEAEMRMLADVAATTADPLSAYRAAAKIMQRGEQGGLGVEEIDILTTQGTDVYGALRRRLGLRRNEVGDFGQTAAGARQITGALRAEWTDPSGTIAGAAARRLDNLSIKWNEFKEAVKEAVEELGKGLGRSLHESLEEFTGFITDNKGALKAFGEGVKWLIDIFRVFGGVITGVNAATGNLLGWGVGLASIAMGLTGFAKILNLVSPHRYLLGLVGNVAQGGRAVGGFASDVSRKVGLLREHRRLTQGIAAELAAIAAAPLTPGLAVRGWELTHSREARRARAATRAMGDKTAATRRLAGVMVEATFAAQKFYRSFGRVGQVLLRAGAWTGAAAGVTALAGAAVSMVDASGKLAEFEDKQHTFGEWAAVRGEQVKDVFKGIRDYVVEAMQSMGDLMNDVAVLGATATSAGAAMAARDPASRAATERMLRTRYRGSASGPRNPRAAAAARLPTALAVAEMRAPWEDAPGLDPRANMLLKQQLREASDYWHSVRMLRAGNPVDLALTYEALGPMRGPGRGAPMHYAPSFRSGRDPRGVWTDVNFRDQYERFGWGMNRYAHLTADRSMGNQDSVLTDLLEQQDESVSMFKEKVDSEWTTAMRAVIDGTESGSEALLDMADEMGRDFRSRLADQYFGKALKDFIGKMLDTAYEAITERTGNKSIFELFTVLGYRRAPGGGVDGVGIAAGAPSLDGGGYTGSGARLGGIDGRGGFWAVMHPQETVIDHTKGGVTVQVQNFGPPARVRSAGMQGGMVRVAIESAKAEIMDEMANNGPAGQVAAAVYGLDAVPQG